MIAALVLGLGLSPGAQAKCSVACLNHRVKQLSNGLTKAEKTISSLSRTVSAQGQTIAQQQQALAGLGAVGKKVDSLFECLFEVPVTQFGVPEKEEGYLYKNLTETVPITALDVPYEGEPIGAWFLIDGCNTIETAGVKAAKALLPPAPNLRTLLQPRSRLLP